MLVSIIIPTLNRAQVIHRAIASALQQTHPQVEIIVIDDGSTDDTETVVARIARQSTHRIFFFKQPNSGCAAARNKGLEFARGDFILFLDSDDALVPTAVAALLAAVTSAAADFAYSPAVEKYPDGTEAVNLPVAAGRPANFAAEHFYCTNARNGAVLFRRTVFASVGGMDENLRHNEDSDFLQRVAIQHKAAYAQSPSVTVYHHDNRKSGNRVAIYRALLKSTENILRTYPAFTAALGSGAERRIEQIKLQLVEALILDGRFAEAGAEAQTVRQQLRFDLRAALLLSSALPVVFLRTILAMMRRLGSIMRAQQKP
jgi:glycosyltransferase involved in cell wall biosynthesis